MNNNTRNFIIAAVIILVVICLCLGVLALGGAFAWLRGAQTAVIPPTLPGPAVTVPVSPPEVTPLQPATRTPTLEPEAAPTTVPDAEPTAEPTAAGEDSAELPPEILQAMQAIEQQVMDLRELQPDDSAFSRTLLTPEQLRERVENDFLQDYTPEEASRDSVVLSSFGLLEPGFDLIDLYTELFSEQIAGYYDDETKEMVVVQGAGFEGPEKITYAHEYVHALQDQNYDLKNGLGFDDELCEQDSERCAALQALLEGDATLAEEGWLVNYATQQDRLELFEFYSDIQTPVFLSAPAFLQEDFLFPYLQGRLFVQNFWEQDQWDAIAALYQDPPVSTEQILHPEKYPQDTPLSVDLPDLAGILGDGWEEIDRDVMGEWYTYLILARGVSPETRIDDAQASQAADGWGGDAYAVYQDPESGEVALVWRTRWDTPDEAAEFAQTFLEYATARYQGEPQEPQPGTYVWETGESFQQFVINEDDGETVWLAAPDAELAGLISDALAAP